MRSTPFDSESFETARVSSFVRGAACVGSVAEGFLRGLVGWPAWMLALGMLLSDAYTASGLEHVEIRKDGVTKTVSGQIVVEAQDGGLLLQTPDGRMHTLQPEAIVGRNSDAVEFQPLTADQLAAKLLAELPKGFRIHRTEHYVICHVTSDEYATWCGGLLERLYDGFHNFWKQRDVQLSEPRFPLVAVIFPDQASFAKHGKNEVGQAVNVMIGYYHFGNNRTMMYDLTGAQALRAVLGPRARRMTVRRTLQHPAAERLIATVIHEACHQLAFNCGLQTRYADNPLWFSEGLAMYFEPPDVRSRTGWRTLGAVNNYRLIQFRQQLAKRPNDRLQRLIADDKFLRSSPDVAYSESWALTYFLIRARRKQFIDYLHTISKKDPLIWDTPQQRVTEFREAFGDLDKLDRDFLRYMKGVQPRGRR